MTLFKGENPGFNKHNLIIESGGYWLIKAPKENRPCLAYSFDQNENERHFNSFSTVVTMDTGWDYLII